MGAFLDLTGMRFGKLTAISRAKDYTQTNGRKRTAWICRCDCGNTITALAENLKSGATTSCGCYRRECTSTRVSTHCETDTPLYGVWCTMKSRCYNKNVKYYGRYGARGIGVCDSWLDCYENFRDWAIKSGYSEGLSIDRIDNNKGYSPDNCRWASSAEQANNRSSNNLITFRGETHNVTEWARILGINPKTIFTRLYSGWSIERALSAT